VLIGPSLSFIATAGANCSGTFRTLPSRCSDRKAHGFQRRIGQPVSRMRGGGGCSVSSYGQPPPFSENTPHHENRYR
jgi:hypothetical protein